MREIEEYYRKDDVKANCLTVSSVILGERWRELSCGDYSVLRSKRSNMQGLLCMLSLTVFSPRFTNHTNHNLVYICRWGAIGKSFLSTSIHIVTQAPRVVNVNHVSKAVFQILHELSK